MSSPAPLRIGTRGSPLALAQANHVAEALHRLTDGRLATVLHTYTTTGDQLTTERLTESGGKGLFTREIDRALDAGEIDIAVHSLKDVPSVLPEGQVFVAFPPREDAREAFVSRRFPSLAALPQGARVGTASVRREAQLRALRPDLEIAVFRGNVQTRLRKLDEGLADATFLALAGLNRLGLSHLATEVLGPEHFLSAPCQGIVGVVARHETLSPEARIALAAFNDAGAHRAALAERAFLARLDGSCRTPIAAHLFTTPEGFTLKGEVLSPDGAVRLRGEVHLDGRHDQPDALRALGVELAEDLLARNQGRIPAFAAVG
jgi:hydroxymethylbilane synthase